MKTHLIDFLSAASIVAVGFFFVAWIVGCAATTATGYERIGYGSGCRETASGKYVDAALCK